MSNADKKPPSAWEYLLNELRQGWQDIRQKVVEEGWFGRVTTAAPVVEINRVDPSDNQLSREALLERPSFAETWGPRELTPDRGRSQAPGHDQELGEPSFDDICGMVSRNRAVEREKELLPPEDFEHDLDH